MANTYPTTLNSYATGTSSATLATAGHASAHNAYEAKIGTGASTPINARLLRGTGTGTSSWAQAILTTDVTGVLPVANGGTGAGSLTGVLIGNGTSAVTVVTAPSGTILGTSDTQTLTNKRITKRVVTVTQSATPTINTDNTDVAYITGLAQAVTSFTTNLTGTPVNGDTLIIDITDNGTGRALTFGASFEASTVALPTTTVLSTKLTIGFRWNTVTSKWTCVAVA